MRNGEYPRRARPQRLIAAALAVLAFGGSPAHGQAVAPPAWSPTYADLADLADDAELVARVQIRKQIPVEPERSPGLRPGWIRLYIEAATQALLSGQGAIGQTVRYLADVPLDARGKAPKLKKRSVILFGRPVSGSPSDLQLVTPDAQLFHDDALEARLRPILQDFASPDAPPEVLRIRDALSVEGNLAGESETQLFLDTADGAPVSLSIVRRPGMAPQWGVSWTEIVDQAARPPAPETLAWYRLACFLPDSLPYETILSRDGASRVRAAQDYRLVVQTLGPCPRNRP